MATPPPSPLVLGIETSCDETAAAVVGGDGTILSNVVLSQVSEHAVYGGVVPEIAARAHVRYLPQVIAQALAQAGVEIADIDAVAATGGPGLIGGVIVGMTMGKAMAAAAEKAFIAVNHLEGHALTVRLTHQTPFPYLLLLVSGGHCQFVIVHALGRYERLGGTLDDALGEAFDKVAKLLGLGYPGGPAVEKLARTGDANAYDFPVPLLGRAGCDFSFSGLKTAVRLAAERDAPLAAQQKADICAAFQQAACASLEDRSRNAMAVFRARCPAGASLVLAGGVAANQRIREQLREVAETAGLSLICPPAALCTDNAAMIAWAGMERYRANLLSELDAEPRARWPLEELQPPQEEG